MKKDQPCLPSLLYSNSFLQLIHPTSNDYSVNNSQRAPEIAVLFSALLSTYMYIFSPLQLLLLQLKLKLHNL